MGVWYSDLSPLRSYSTMASLSPTLLKYSQGIYKIERWTIFGILRSWNEKRYVGHLTRTEINRFSVENLLKTWICLFFCATASKCWDKFNYTFSVSHSTWKSIFDNIDLKIFDNYWHSPSFHFINRHRRFYAREEPNFDQISKLF